ncbi:MAG: HAD-IA family hydrolase [Pseudomonadales bacterium]
MLIILDWDGTLVDSAGQIVSAMQSAIADRGLDFRDYAQVSGIIGLGLPEAIASLYPAEDDVVREKLRLAYVDHFLADPKAPVFFDGVMETLTVLREEGHVLAIATGKSRRGLNRVLGDLSLLDYFDYTRCADETRSKPHPQMLHELLAHSGTDPQAAVMVGDTTFDMEMALAANIAAVAVEYGVHSSDTLQQLGLDGMLSEFSALRDWIRYRV